KTSREKALTNQEERRKSGIIKHEVVLGCFRFFIRLHCRSLDTRRSILDRVAQQGLAIKVW
ncbi:hypothetical protein, partial [Salmonella sp. s54925]|uniref:hypothetical protein n=1 Tax=Salmonella sp. s54925 TaxID=3159674 RepID=UPI00397F4607